MKPPLLALLSIVTASLGFSDGARAAAFKSSFSVDLARYAGLWYEAGRTPNRFQDNRPERGGERFSACTDTTADYAIESPGVIRVTNRCMRRSEQGKTFEDVAEGIARVEDGSGGRKLKVAFGPAIARFLQRTLAGGGGDYWIYCLGPIDGKERYQWAVISGAKRDFIFLLTRKRAVSAELRRRMLACARAERLPVDELVYRQE